MLNGLRRLQTLFLNFSHWRYRFWPGLKKGVNFLKTQVKTWFAAPVPWFLCLGQAGTGKRTLIEAFEHAQTRVSALQVKSHACQFKALDILEHGVASAQTTIHWTRKTRRGFQGLCLVIHLPRYLALTQTEQKAYRATVTQHIAALGETLKAQPRVFLLLTHLDQVPGFQPFVTALAPAALNSALGLSEFSEAETFYQRLAWQSTHALEKTEALATRYQRLKFPERLRDITAHFISNFQTQPGYQGLFFTAHNKSGTYFIDGVCNAMQQRRCSEKALTPTQTPAWKIGVTLGAPILLSVLLWHHAYRQQMHMIQSAKAAVPACVQSPIQMHCDVSSLLHAKNTILKQQLSWWKTLGLAKQTSLSALQTRLLTSQIEKHYWRPLVTYLKQCVTTSCDLNGGHVLTQLIINSDLKQPEHLTPLLAAAMDKAQLNSGGIPLDKLSDLLLVYLNSPHPQPIDLPPFPNEVIPLKVQRASLYELLKHFYLKTLPMTHPTPLFSTLSTFYLKQTFETQLKSRFQTLSVWLASRLQVSLHYEPKNLYHLFLKAYQSDRAEAFEQALKSDRAPPLTSSALQQALKRFLVSPTVFSRTFQFLQRQWGDKTNQTVQLDFSPYSQALQVFGKPIKSFQELHAPLEALAEARNQLESLCFDEQVKQGMHAVLTQPIQLILKFVMHRAAHLAQREWGRSVWPAVRSINELDREALTPVLSPAHGRLWTFQRSALSPFLLNVGEQLALLPWENHVLPLTDQFMARLAQAKRLSKVLWPPANAPVSFRIQLLPNPKLAQVLLQVGDRFIQYRHEPQHWINLAWTARQKHALTTLTVLPSDRSAEVSLEFAGPWSFYRFLRRATFEKLGPHQFQATWRLKHGEAQALEVRALIEEGEKHAVSALLGLPLRFDREIVRGRSF